MTSFGATKVIQDNFMPTFKVSIMGNNKILPPCGWCKIRWQLTIDVSSSELPKATRSVFTEVDGEMAVLLTYFASHMAVQRLGYTITYINIYLLLQIQGQISNRFLIANAGQWLQIFAHLFYGRFSKTSRYALCTQQFGEKTNCGTTPNIFPSTQRIGYIIQDRIRPHAI
jgi:hypothetical protein